MTLSNAIVRQNVDMTKRIQEFDKFSHFAKKKKTLLTCFLSESEERTDREGLIF